jgi:hypothetical protein
MDSLRRGRHAFAKDPSHNDLAQSSTGRTGAPLTGYAQPYGMDIPPGSHMLIEQVAAINHSFADPAPYVAAAHAAGVKLFVQVQTVAVVGSCGSAACPLRDTYAPLSACNLTSRALVIYSG